MKTPIPPGSPIGVFGGGQLGRMFTQKAKEMGYLVSVFTPTKNSPAGQIADREIVADYLDQIAVEDFARSLSGITLEFENIPKQTVLWAEAITRVCPSSNALFVTQNRIREKTFFIENNLPTVAFERVTSLQELTTALHKIPPPCVLKTASLGYDGKGQAKLKSEIDAQLAWEQLQTGEAILEEFVTLQRELSVIVARSSHGDIVCFEPFENTHQNHILDVTLALSSVSEEMKRKAKAFAVKAIEQLQYVGILCVEMFVTSDNTILLNELAPRPHNSGHLTIDAYDISQYELQVRTLCDLPLATPKLLQPAAMVNLLGDIWTNGEPAWGKIQSLPGVTLHLYGKTSPRPGRKMGHITACASSIEDATSLALKARELIQEH